MTRVYKSVSVHPSGRVDPAHTIVECEADGCTADVCIDTSYSFVVVFATTGASHIAAFQCESEQHYACSPQHAIDAATACMREHLLPEHTRRQVARDSEQSTPTGDTLHP